MGSEWRFQTIPLVLEGGIHMPYSWTVGRVGSRFFEELRDRGRILASMCSGCHKVYVPPRLRCPVCFCESKKDMRYVGPAGFIRHFTVVHYHHPVQPIKPPFAYAVIDLDGADNGITHFVRCSDYTLLEAGTRVFPVMARERKGCILDIAYFEPAGG